MIVIDFFYELYNINMAGSIRENSLMLYLRPAEEQQRYILRNVADWLVSKGDFKDFGNALSFLLEAEYKNPGQYKSVISMYHAANDYISRFKPERKYNMTFVNNYQTSNTNTYGEPHMY